MECFNDLIGVKELCNSNSPKSSIYLDDVGISLNDIEAFITSQYSTASDYFESRKNHAVREMTQQIYSYFQGNYLATSLVDSHRLGIYSGVQSILTGSTYKGIQLNFNQSDTFFKVGISQVDILLAENATIDLEIWDLLENKLLLTQSVSCVANQTSKVYLHQSYKSQKKPLNIFIGYDATNIDHYSFPIKNGLCCGKLSCTNNYLSSYGVQVVGDFYDDNVKAINNTGGISVIYDITCDHMSWMCSHAESLALPLAYKIGEVMITDALYNTSGERSTNHHTINIDQLKERHTFYVQKYVDIMQNWLSNMQLPNNRCFQCNTPTRHKIMLP